ncbi:MAG: ISAon1 family transposase [Mucilaginibacter sp.]
MSTACETLVRLILPEGILEYFELTDVRSLESGQLNIYLEENNLPPAGYDKQQLESKGFLPETAIQDFPIRGHKVALCIKRRRWLDAESKAIEHARQSKHFHQSKEFSNGDTLKQLLARSRYLLFKHESRWTTSQKERADLLFPKYPELLKAYKLAIGLGNIFTICKTKQVAFKRLALWYNYVEESGIDAFKTVARSVHQHYESILNFFDNRSTNASAESFNAKIKAFRATSRGVRDTTFFLFRLANIYA